MGAIHSFQLFPLPESIIKQIQANYMHHISPVGRCKNRNGTKRTGKARMVDAYMETAKRTEMGDMEVKMRGET